MSEWKNIKIEGISRIEKCVAEFQVWEIGRIPSSKFKVKIFEDQNGHFTGFTNLGIKSLLDGSPEFGVGSGKNIAEALENTVNYFVDELNKRQDLTEEDFEWADPDDF
jgi:hypothetical protein